MPGKQHPSLASHPRLLLSAVLATMLIAVLALWSATRDRDPDPPLMIMPALGAVPVPSTTPPAPTAVPSSRPPSAGATTKVPASAISASVSKSPRPSRSPSRRPSPSPTPAAESAFAAHYVSSAERRGTFQAGLVIENVGRAAGEWEARITFDDDDRVRVERAFGARAGTTGDTVTFRGGPLEPGRSTMIGFQASTTADGEIRPRSCQVDGRACTISFR